TAASILTGIWDLDRVLFPLVLSSGPRNVPFCPRLCLLDQVGCHASRSMRQRIFRRRLPKWMVSSRPDGGPVEREHRGGDLRRIVTLEGVSRGCVVTADELQLRGDLLRRDRLQDGLRAGRRELGNAG